MFTIDVETTAHGDDRQAVDEFLERYERTVGSAPLSDHLRLDRNDPSPGFVALVARDDGEVVGYAQLSAANDGHVLEVVVPEVERKTLIERELLEAAIAAQRREHPNDPITWWADDPDAMLDESARQSGLAPHRSLHEMRRSLPHPEHSTVETRSFEPGIDDEAWIGVNNRAFASHGEQGGWTLTTLRLRQQEPWFDPEGFRIHVDDSGRIDAFCWTKVHDADDPSGRIGEIYVIAVDPAAHGRGLGRQLTLAGLESIAARGITTANLYVDGDNTAAVALYERLGFRVHRTRYAYHGTPDVPS